MILSWVMSPKVNENYELLWEMVYHNPKEVKGTPARLLVKINTNDPIAHRVNIYDWVENHSDQIAKTIIKAVKNKESKYKFIKVFKVPFYLDP